MTHDTLSSLNTEDIIHALSNYIMLKSIGMGKAGLYYGWSGISISLFESSRILNDKYMEDFAFTLLQQSLTYKNLPVNFRDGLSGIGYALMYLIHHQFVKTNFKHIFQEQEEQIVEWLMRKNINQMGMEELVDSFYLAIYFSYVSNIPMCISKLQEINNECAERFTNLWGHILTKNFCDDKEYFLDLWKKFLQILISTKYENNVQSIKLYCKLLDDGYFHNDNDIIYLLCQTKVGYEIARHHIMKNRNCNNYSQKYIFHKIGVSLFLHQNENRHIVQQICHNRNLTNLETTLNKITGDPRNGICLKNGVSQIVLRIIHTQYPANKHIPNLLTIL